jgi:phosphatidate phosphatase APP1
MAGYGAGSVPEPSGRRRKLAALAGSVYRAGAAAASELKEQYSNTRLRNVDESDVQQITIPGSFPNVAIVTKGQEQMVLFPSYAKRHIRQFGKDGPSRPAEAQGAAQTSMNDEDYWKQEWARMEDEKAIVDVDVRGWVYTPHTGPMTRRNRVLIGLARRLSGIPPPTTQSNQTMASMHEEHERMREEQKIAREAKEIERRGQAEKEAASRGGYSEAPRDSDSDGETDNTYMSKTRSGGTISPMSSAPSSPVLAASQRGGLTPEELLVANANMMARLGPFLTNPLVESPVTLFFYNDEQSQSRTVMTNDSGHFITRVALDFIPTHVRVLAAESSLSVTEPVKIIENAGVSLISDVDDTIKRSSISMGAREIFRNTFIRDLGDLAVDGVREWYNRLHDMGVSIHYCSNSPWQLFPVLASFFQIAGLPPGSIHLKQYSGMLQGIFEPVAERKKGTLERILRDFPDRKFLLVGDSGEADLEVYTDLAVGNPGRILAVFIRDVTTPDIAGYFDKSLSGGFQKITRSQTMQSRLEMDKQSSSDSDRPALPPRVESAPSKPEAAVVEDLIDFSDEPQQITPPPNERKTSVSALDLLSRKAPPPRPAKPAALRSTPSEVALGMASNSVDRARKTSGPSHPLAQMQTLSDQSASNTNLPASKRPSNTSSSNSSSTSSKQALPPLPPPRRKSTASSVAQQSAPRLPTRRTTANSDIDFDPLPGSGATTPTGGGVAPAVNKKLEMWRRRLARSHDLLDQQGVQLYTWRKGDDVIVEAEGIVRRALEEMKRKGGGDELRRKGGR